MKEWPIPWGLQHRGWANSHGSRSHKHSLKKHGICWEGIAKSDSLKASDRKTQGVMLLVRGKHGIEVLGARRVTLSNTFAHLGLYLCLFSGCHETLATICSQPIANADLQMTGASLLRLQHPSVTIRVEIQHCRRRENKCLYDLQS